MSVEDKEWVKENKECPACHSGRRFFEELGKEMKERQLVPDDTFFCYELKQGALTDEQMMERLPIGSEIPAFVVAIDICMDCGCFYAIKLQKQVAKKGLAPIRIVPNRAARRRGERNRGGFILPGSSNN